MLKLWLQDSPTLAGVFLAHKLQDKEVAQEDTIALRKVAGLFVVKGDQSVATLSEAANNLHGRYSDLILRAQQIESLRLSLLNKCPQETSRLLAKLGIEKPAFVEDAMFLVSPSVSSLVRLVGEDIIELQFPAAGLTTVQRLAFGMDDVESFLIRICVDELGKPIEFCVHLSNDTREVHHE